MKSIGGNIWNVIRSSMNKDAVTNGDNNMPPHYQQHVDGNSDEANANHYDGTDEHLGKIENAYANGSDAPAIQYC